MFSRWHECIDSVEIGSKFRPLDVGIPLQSDYYFWTHPPPVGEAMIAEQMDAVCSFVLAEPWGRN
jgi:hypothetical protein